MKSRKKDVKKLKSIKKDVNKNLLVLITFFLFLFLGFTIYYQSALNKVSNENSDNERILDEITANMVVEKLNNPDKSSQLALIDKAVLEEKYNKMVSYSGGLELEKARLEKEVIVLKSKLEYNNVRIEGPVSQFRMIQDKNEIIENLNEEIGYLCGRLRNHSIAADGCQK
jgi:hypothetical protein